MSDQFLFQHFLRKDWKGSCLLSKKRQKKHKRKVLITSRRFNWRYFSKWRTTQPWLYLILAFDDIQLRLIRNLNLSSFLFVQHFLFILFFYFFIVWAMKRPPSQHLLVLKTSSTRLQRNNFTSSKTSWRRLAKTSWSQKIVTLKTSWRHVLKTSWKHYEDKQNSGDICI